MFDLFLEEVIIWRFVSCMCVFTAIFDRLRAILMDADIDKRIQYMIEVIFTVRRDKFKVSITMMFCYCCDE